MSTEFPYNPLLKSPALKRLYEPSKSYDFVLVVDHITGTAVNVALLPFCPFATYLSAPL